MGICNTLLSALCTAPSPILPSALRLSGCPPARGWWHSNPQPETPPVLDRPEWRVPALAARVRRAIRDVDAAFESTRAASANGCGCTYCQPDRRHTRPAPEGRGPVEHRPCGPILAIWCTRARGCWTDGGL